MANRTYCMLIDIKRDIFEIIKLKPIDTGNRLHIKFSEDGKPVDLTGQTVKFMAIKPDGTGVYNFATVTDAKAGEIEVEITNQMTAVDGELDCEIEIEGNGLITTMTFYITVDRKLNDGNFIESTNEFTVLQKAIKDAYKAIELMETKTDAKLEELQGQVDTAIDSMNETTDTKLSQVQSQVNTAISNMNTTTTNKLSQLQSQVNSAIENMDSVTDTKLADLQKQVTSAISNMNSTTTNKLNQVQTQVNDKLTDIQSQFDTLETGLTKKVNDKITEVTGTQTTLTNTVNAKITELTNTVNGKITEVNNKLKAVDSKISEVNTTITNANNTVDQLEEAVATAISGIDTKIDSKLANKAEKTHNHDTSYLKLTGGTITGSLAVSGDLNIVGAIRHNGTNIIRNNGTSTIISSKNGTMYLRPVSDTSTTGEVTINTSGTLNATNITVGGANVYHTGRKPTPAEIGASSSNHLHDDRYFRKVQEIGANVDLNTLIATGRYHQNSNANATTALNYPTTKAGLLKVYNDGYIYQEYHCYDNSGAYRRTKYGETWYKWASLQGPKGDTGATGGVGPAGPNTLSTATTTTGFTNGHFIFNNNGKVGAKAITPDLIGALSKSGGTITGHTTFNRGIDITGVSSSGISSILPPTTYPGYSRTFYDSSNKELVICGVDNIRLSAGGDLVYTTNRKPTPAEIGALSTSGGTITNTVAPQLTVKNSGGTDSAIVLDRNTNANWKILNNSGTFKLQCDYTTSKGTYYDAMRLDYNTGAVWFKGCGFVGSGDNNTYHLPNNIKINVNWWGVDANSTRKITLPTGLYKSRVLPPVICSYVTSGDYNTYSTSNRVAVLHWDLSSVTLANYDTSKHARVILWTIGE